MMMQRLTAPARQVMSDVIQRGGARPTYSDVVLALLRVPKERTTVAQAALSTTGVTLAKAEDASRTAGSVEISLDELESVVMHEARSLVHNYPGPEHLLLALTSDAFQPTAKEYFAACGTTAEEVRREVLSILGYLD